VCQYGKNCTITSGGGFSNFFTEPIFQSAAVADYINTAKQYEHSPYPGYGIRGRGYPDIAFAGAKFLVRIGGKFYGISGTSASAPGVAGMFSNINAARMALGKGPVGWINPALYANADSFVNDITSGDNHCAADGLCCPQGFWAGPGWDPVTGLGTLNYGFLSKIFVELGQINGAKYFPSYRPIFTPRPSTGTPSYKPSTATPTSGKPSRTPTGAPSASPTESTFTYMEATQVT
jgi:subtilase family serine protease